MSRHRVLHRPSPRRRLQKFPDAMSFNAALSSIASASSFFSLRFSSSSWRSRRISDTVIVPYLAFQLYSVASLIPCCRHTSPAFPPDLCCRTISMIFSSANRLFFIVRSSKRGLYTSKRVTFRGSEHPHYPAGGNARDVCRNDTVKGRIHHPLD